jgi:hypothetical protein
MPYKNIYIYTVAAPRNFFRVFITKLKYNNITKKKNLIFRGLFCYYGLKQVLLFELILLLWMLFELFFCYLDFLFLGMVNWVY